MSPLVLTHRGQDINFFERLVKSLPLPDTSFLHYMVKAFSIKSKAYRVNFRDNSGRSWCIIQQRKLSKGFPMTITLQVGILCVRFLQSPVTV